MVTVLDIVLCRIVNQWLSMSEFCDCAIFLVVLLRPVQDKVTVIPSLFLRSVLCWKAAYKAFSAIKERLTLTHFFPFGFLCSAWSSDKWCITQQTERNLYDIYDILKLLQLFKTLASLIEGHIDIHNAIFFSIY